MEEEVSDSENESVRQLGDNFNFVDGSLTNDGLGCFDFCDRGPVFNASEVSEDETARGTSVAATEIHWRRRMDSKSVKQLNVNNSSQKFKFRRKRKVRADKKSGDWTSTSTSTSSIVSDCESESSVKKMLAKNKIVKKIDVNSLSNYLNWRLISTCLSYKLSSEKDSELLDLTLQRNFAKFKCTKLSVVTELKLMLIFISIWAFLITCGALRWGENFFAFESLFDSSLAQKGILM